MHGHRRKHEAGADTDTDLSVALGTEAPGRPPPSALQAKRGPPGKGGCTTVHCLCHFAFGDLGAGPSTPSSSPGSRTSTCRACAKSSRSPRRRRRRGQITGHGLQQLSRYFTNWAPADPAPPGCRQGVALDRTRGEPCAGWTTTTGSSCWRTPWRGTWQETPAGGTPYAGE